MSVPVNELTENDYRILKYINKFSHVSKEQIEHYFNGKIDAIDFRLSVLAKIERSSMYKIPIENSSYIVEEFEDNYDDYEVPPKSKNIFHISQLGKSVLQDYLEAKKSERKSNLKSAAFKICNLILSIIAIIISIISLLKK